jgi:hypothetical protein
MENRAFLSMRPTWGRLWWQKAGAAPSNSWC